MFSDIMNIVLQFKYIILADLFVSAVVVAISLILIQNLSWKGNRLKFLGILKNLDTRLSVILALIAQKCIFVLTCVFFNINMSTALIIFFVMISLTGSVLKRKFYILIIDTANALIFSVTLVIGNILSGYISEVSGDIMLKIVRLMWCACIVIYSVFLLIKEAEGFVNSSRLENGGSNEKI